MTTLRPKQSAFLFFSILLIAVNLRAALASVGPLIDRIQASTHLSSSALGLLTTLPLIAFGTISLLAPVFTKRYGLGRVLFAAMILLTVGILLRSVQAIPLLYLGTLLVGIAIAFGNVLLPTLTKRNFARHSGLVTSLYSSTMAIGATIAAGVSVPLANTLKGGWPASLRFWAIFSALAAVVWIPQLWRLKKVPTNRSVWQQFRKMAGKSLAWKVSLFMGLQSFGFYVMLAWLPAILINRGYSIQSAGWLLSLSQATGIFGSLIVPYVAGKQTDQRRLVWVLITLEVLSLMGLLYAPLQLEWLWVGINGFVLGGTFGLSLLFIVLKSDSTDTATELSGMAQAIGYGVAATGPLAVGAVYDLTAHWNTALYILLGVCMMKLMAGLTTAKPHIP